MAIKINIGRVAPETLVSIRVSPDHAQPQQRDSTIQPARSGAEGRQLMYAALAHQQAGNMAGAVELHLQAVALAPDDPTVLTVAGDALRHSGRLREAVGLFDAAIRLDPRAVAAWYGRALALESHGAVAEAEQSFRRVTELAPHTAPGFAGLATMQARSGELEAARASAARAAALGPQDAGTVIAQARCDMLARDYGSAALRLKALTDRPDLLPQDAVLALGLLGGALDRLDDRQGAFEAWARANRRFVEAHGGPDAPPAALRLAEDIDAATARLAPTATGPWPAGLRAAKQHIFLLGYPRSGTTLVEQVLGTIEGAVTIEEEPTLALAASRYLSDAGLSRLAALSEDEVAELRADYWRRVADAGADVKDKAFIDMDPLKTPSLPLIARLFPDAKIIMMRRDPRDVIWSCFRQTFAYNPVTVEFTSLERTARHYAAVMRLAQTCFSTFAMDVFDLRYEELVADFDTTTRRLCAFAGLSWTEKLRDFPERARKVPVKTASATQVTQPLYDGSGQWRRYADRIEPVLPLLRPWLPQSG